MKARLTSTMLRTGGIARDFVRTIQGRRSRPQQRERHSSGAARVLEDCKEPYDPFGEDRPFDAYDLIAVLDGGLADFAVIPYYFSAAAREDGQDITIGSCVFICGDELRRPFIVVKVDAEAHAVRIQDAEHNGYVIPWDLIEPWKQS